MTRPETISESSSYHSAYDINDKSYITLSPIRDFIYIRDYQLEVMHALHIYKADTLSLMHHINFAVQIQIYFVV